MRALEREIPLTTGRVRPRLERRSPGKTACKTYDRKIKPGDLELRTTAKHATGGGRKCLSMAGALRGLPLVI